MRYIIALLIFGIIVLVHEFGHFITAKLCNIKVNQFAVGMGPSLYKKQYGETEYSIRILPVGGFCMMEGEEENSDSSRSFHSKPKWQRLIVLAAGAALNILLGFVIAVIVTCMDTNILTTEISSFHTVSETNEQYAAKSYDSGLREGDRITKVNGMSILTIQDLQYALLSAEDESYDIVVERDGSKTELDNVNFEDKTTGKLIDFYVCSQNKDPLTVLTYSAKYTVSTVKLVWLSLKDLVFGKYSVKDMSGPVGLVSAIGEAAKSGSNFKESLMSILSLTILITINLGIVNLLPIPGLDGGKLLFLLIEAVRGKPVSKEREGMVHLIGMAIIFLLIILVTFNDIKRLIS